MTQAKLRAYVGVLAATLAFALTPHATFAQVRTAISVGYGGGGPIGVLMLRADAGVALVPQLRAGASVLRLNHGNGVCAHQIPSPCDGRATVYAANLGYEVVAGQGLPAGLFLRAGALLHDFSGIGTGAAFFVDPRQRMGVMLDAGMRARIYGPVGLQFSGMGIHVFDADDYADAVGRQLRYTIASIGLSVDW